MRAHAWIRKMSQTQVREVTEMQVTSGSDSSGSDSFGSDFSDRNNFTYLIAP